jgi:two-component system CheB/CheR fusion protein
MPYRTTENVIDGVVMTFINIQQQVGQAGEKMRRFATVLEDSNDAVTVRDFNGRILAWNKGAEKMYGWTESEALKMNAADLLPTENQEETKTLFEQIKKGEPVKSFKTRRKAKTGEILEIWLTATALRDKSGRPVEVATTERNFDWFSKESKCPE